jgi:hypothetical protein
LHIISKLFGIKIPEHPGSKNPDEASSTLKVDNYNAIVKTSSDVSGESEEIPEEKS